MVDWNSEESALLLNPRLPWQDRERYEKAWARFNKDQSFAGQVGIATSGSSGGTTGDSGLGRLVVLSKKALLTSAAAVNERFSAGSQDVWMKTLPTFHVGGLGIYARAYLSGSQVIESTLPRWEPLPFLEELKASKATLLSLVPTQLYDFVAAGVRAPVNLRAVVVGGGKLSADLHERARRLGWPIHASYGLTECCSQVATALSPDDPRLMPLRHVEVRLGEKERIEIRSEALLTGWIEFLSDEAKFSDPKVEDWFLTEDRGALNADGSLTALGRVVDFVKIGGEGVSLVRLEEKFTVLKERFFNERDAAVLAAYDERLGAKIVVLSEAENEALKALIEQFNQEVLPFERIRSVHVLQGLPRSSLGKLLRGQALALAGLKPVDRP